MGYQYKLKFILILGMCLGHLCLSGMQLPVLNSRVSDTDLKVEIPAKQKSFYVSWDMISKMTLHKKSLPIETVSKLQEVRGVYLKDLVGLLPVDEWELLLADCSDGYQSNYTPQQLAQNKAFLILKIEGKPLPEWAKAKGNPGWGPYMIMILEEGDLLDPVNKNPWGVEKLVFGSKTDMWDVYSKFASNDTYEGFKIFKGNCMSCHSVGKGEQPLGGKVSTRNTEILSMLAKYSEPYFLSVLKDPVGANPLAEKMPAVTHYSEEQIAALITFMKRVTE